MFIKHKKKFLATLLVAAMVVIAAIIGLRYYWYIFKPNVKIENKKGYAFLLIPTGATYSTVSDSIIKNNYIRNSRSFEWLANKKGYPEGIKPGRYRIKNGMSNLELLRLLSSGKQEPVMLVFNNIRTKADLAGRIGRQIEADSTELLKLLNDPDFLAGYDVTPATALGLFIPNSYEFYWNTSAKGFIIRMAKEKKKFWNEERIEKSTHTGLTIDEVVTLASIVEKETNKDSEKPTIAGVYINRLRKDWPLQADPTLIFAMNDYTIKRLRAEHKLVQSSYNTYINKGLPPGPICLPSISSIDAVLNYSRHNYMYFCAREDLSGYHIFASTIDQHSKNAARYRSALNRLDIR